MPRSSFTRLLCVAAFVVSMTPAVASAAGRDLSVIEFARASWASGTLKAPSQPGKCWVVQATLNAFNNYISYDNAPTTLDQSLTTQISVSVTNVCTGAAPINLLAAADPFSFFYDTANGLKPTSHFLAPAKLTDLRATDFDAYVASHKNQLKKQPAQVTASDARITFGDEAGSYAFVFDVDLDVNLSGNADLGTEVAEDPGVLRETSYSATRKAKVSLSLKGISVAVGDVSTNKCEDLPRTSVSDDFVAACQVLIGKTDFGNAPASAVQVGTTLVVTDYF